MANNVDVIEEHLRTTSELIRLLITESKVKMQAVQISSGFFSPWFFSYFYGGTETCFCVVVIVFVMQVPSTLEHFIVRHHCQNVFCLHLHFT